jgi:uncharacterized protein (TIGR03067 family)
MKSFLLAGLACLSILTFVAIAADAPKAEAPAKEDKALLGKWTVTSAEMMGEKNADMVGATMEFTAEKLTFKAKDDDAKSASYKLDTKASPKQIDVNPLNDDGKPLEDKMMTLIYEVDGDTLRLCGPDRPGEARPKTFESKKDPGTVLLVLKRAK